MKMLKVTPSPLLINGWSNGLYMVVKGLCGREKLLLLVARGQGIKGRGGREGLAGEVSEAEDGRGAGGGEWDEETYGKWRLDRN